MGNISIINSCKHITSIEGRLKEYLNDENPTDRNEIMWHAWKHNKRWLSQIQEWIMPSFPNYSRHDESHSLSILHNIEMLLGREQIQKLSASDCFLILHVVYIHDIGMCITHEDREGLMESKEFIKFLEMIKEGGEGAMKKYANRLLAFCHDMPIIDSPNKLLKIKLEVYYAILYLVSEFKRKEHPTNSKNLLNEWIDSPDKLGVGFSTSGIPSRFFYTVGACASVHASDNFQDILDLHRQDMGFSHDYMHPRFAAILLQLGDSLDLDNDRFHPLVKEFMGELPHNSIVHFDKHKSIRRLRISPNKITIEADCKEPEVLRLVNMECENIKSILRDATFHWSVICPEELNACLPSFEPVVLLLNGEKVKEKMVNMKFEIQQKKAFNLLQGNNIYKDDSFVFLREIFQNAIDASKMQYWSDWKGSRWYKDASITMDEMGEKLSPLAYPVEIELHLAKRKKFENSKPIPLDKDTPENNIIDENYDYGVLIKVIDHGIGITSKDIEAIANVGTSYDHRQKIIEDMPEWLQPTAEFGIGLQSAFLATDSLIAYTRPHTDEEYEIEFQATGDKGTGFINVTPMKEEQKPKTYGTTFEIFVPSEKRKKHQADWESWCGRDPFGKDYYEDTPIRRARELAIQLAVYLNGLIGERLFPLKLRVYDYMKTLENDHLIKEIGGGKFDNFDCKTIINGEYIKGENEKEKEEKEEEKFVTWAYKLSECDDVIMGKVDDEFQFALDCSAIKLYVWSTKKNVYARFGSSRLQSLRLTEKNDEIDKNLLKTKIFYKGVYIKSFNWKEDANLLEYIDIKGKLKREYLAINRGGFTNAGYEYIREEIYPEILRAAHEVLAACKNDSCENDVTLQNAPSVIYNTIEKSIDKINGTKTENDINNDIVQNNILSAVYIATYAQIQSASNYLAPAHIKDCGKWNELLIKLSEKIEEYKKERNHSWTNSTLFNFDVYAMYIQKEEKLFRFEKGFRKNIADILNSKHKYAIVSKRNSVNSSWEGYLVWLNPNQNQKSVENDTEELPIKKDILNLKMQWDLEERKKKIRNIEGWGNVFIESFIDNIKDTLEYQTHTQIINQNKILNWMLGNLPSIAIFFSSDGNLRINILDLEHTDSMYFNIHSKWKIYERMLDTYEKKSIERFSMIATTGYCQLAYKKTRSSVCFIKRGKFSIIGQRYNIFPLNGKTLQSIFDKKGKLDIYNPENIDPNLYKFVLEYDKYIRDISKKYAELEKIDKDEQSDSSSTDELKIISNDESLKHLSIPRLVQEIEILLLDKLYDQKELEENKKIKEDESSHVEDSDELIKPEFLSIFKWSLNKCTLNESKVIEKWISQNIFNKSFKNDDKNTQFLELKEELLKECGLIKDKGHTEQYDSMRRLINSFEKGGWVKLTFEQIEQLYIHFVEDIADEMIQLNSEQKEKEIQNNFLYNQLRVEYKSKENIENESSLIENNLVDYIKECVVDINSKNLESMIENAKEISEKIVSLGSNHENPELKFPINIRRLIKNYGILICEADLNKNLEFQIEKLNGCLRRGKSGKWIMTINSNNNESHKRYIMAHELSRFFFLLAKERNSSEETIENTWYYSDTLFSLNSNELMLDMVACFIMFPPKEVLAYMHEYINTLEGHNSFPVDGFEWLKMLGQKAQISPYFTFSCYQYLKSSLSTLLKNDETLFEKFKFFSGNNSLF